MDYIDSVKSNKQNSNPPDSNFEKNILEIINEVNGNRIQRPKSYEINSAGIFSL